MAEIVEIPLDNEEPPEDIQETKEVEEIPQKEEKPKAKKGRPPGSKKLQKPKPKPRPKPKVKKQPEYEESEDYDDYEEPPTPSPLQRAQTAPMDRNALAAEVLGILQQQRYSQATARRNHYQSWFANM